MTFLKKINVNQTSKAEIKCSWSVFKCCVPINKVLENTKLVPKAGVKSEVWSMYIWGVIHALASDVIVIFK